MLLLQSEHTEAWPPKRPGGGQGRLGSINCELRRAGTPWMWQKRRMTTTSWRRMLCTCQRPHHSHSHSHSSSSYSQPSCSSSISYTPLRCPPLRRCPGLRLAFSSSSSMLLSLPQPSHLALQHLQHSLSPWPGLGTRPSRELRPAGAVPVRPLASRGHRMQQYILAGCDLIGPTGMALCMHHHQQRISLHAHASWVMLLHRPHADKAVYSRHSRSS